MKTLYLFFFLLVMGLFFTLGCKSDGTTSTAAGDTGLQQQSLVGEWAIFEAYKDGKLSKLLDNGKINIGADSTFSTNIMGDPTSYPFKLSGKSIRVSDPRRTRYQVSSLTSDTLILTTKLRNFNFKLSAIKVQ